MSVILKTLADAQNYANTLTIDNEGLPPLTEDPAVVGVLLKHGVQLGKDIFDLDRFIKWTDRRTTSMTQSAAGNNFFSSGPCPITEEQFGKHAPDKVVCLFLSPQEYTRIQSAVGNIGQQLRCVKKYGTPRMNERTGKNSGGRYKSGAFGYWLGGTYVQEVDVPGKGKQMVRYRPTINMAAENSGAGQKTRNREAAQTDVEEHEEEGEE